ncbi:hypothetical protein [Haloarcula rubripromontorii]|uniref:hypothetical protein n=1 Tax=Haloarcula rubripromontorii TaxID=1705562 RepID=UPI0006B4BB03|nr:hypothetical protein [Haloarcula rubripromontorii]
MDDAATQRRFTEAYESDSIDSDEMATALKRYDSLDSDGKREFDDLLARNGDDAAEFAGRTDSDTFDSTFRGCGLSSAPSLGAAGSLRSDRYHSVATPSPSLQSDNGCLPDKLGLSGSEKSKYLSALNAGVDVDSGPITSADELEGLLDDLQGRDGFDEIDEIVRDIQGNKKGFKGLSGEGYVGRALDDRAEIDANDGDVALEKDLSADDIADEYSQDIADDVENSDAFKNVDSARGGSSSDIDAKVNTEVEINGRTLEDPAIESKNLDPDSAEFFRIDNWNGLKKKLRTHAVAGEDEIVVAMDQDYIDVEANRLGGSSSSSSREVLSNRLENDIETTLADELGISKDVTVEVTSYGDI